MSRVPDFDLLWGEQEAESPTRPGPDLRELAGPSDMKLIHWLGMLDVNLIESPAPEVWANQTWVVARDWIEELLRKANFSILGTDSWAQPDPINQGEMTLALRLDPATTEDGRVSSHYVRVQTGFLQDAGGKFQFSPDRRGWVGIPDTRLNGSYRFKVVSEL